MLITKRFGNLGWIGLEERRILIRSSMITIRVQNGLYHYRCLQPRNGYGDMTGVASSTEQLIATDGNNSYDLQIL
jgi:hypothetical protein